MVSRVIPVEDFDLVIFGATGDLSRRKIMPGLLRRDLAGQLPDTARIIGSARSGLSDDSFRQDIAAALAEFGPADVPPDQLQTFLNRLHYARIDAKGGEGWSGLHDLLRPDVVHAFYFSVAPSLFGDLADGLAAHGMADDQARIVVEKPFGRNLDSARALNATLARHFAEHQIYRIDHYLGKETVQNLMAVRFANILFEPLWKSQYIDHVQITVAETVGVGGRGEYYDTSGAIRDMVQNHLMQLLCLIAMEPPYHFDPDAVRDEKLKVIRALQPLVPADVVRGQYQAEGENPGYLADSGDSDSRTESFVAMKVQVANWRWQGVPFYLRTGKKLRARTSEIAVVFKEPPHSIFDDSGEPRANELVIRLQPNEGINLKVMIKEPGPGGMRLVQVPLDMSFAEALGTDGDMPDAYERLIMDVIRGNQTLFMRGDEVEAAWAWIDPIIREWEEGKERPEPYDAGSSGPEESLRLLHRDNRRWREIRA
ncbi:MAG: glucose-6-phosphate dehydrogenase [Paracoccus sp. (in: a-proteobacteria)]|uniref:glucose-6-phosphate dehydrogenase n=1 Tax=Paracoccus sp. TaxID=267 RepID=UPI0026E06066|nr:glucose-6-phosphate dehydrogenase [Paracoccus sp. (in: a-proteobacteria)]MDO5621596.1 glucose-6-phosphate dehydrogenase [Paracoccus sp. (in: a-proteobacteria)]